MEQVNAIVGKISPGPYQWAIFGDGNDPVEYFKHNLSFGSGPVHMLVLPGHERSLIGADPERPEHAVTLCITGNGPNSEANAKALHALLTVRESLKDKPRLPIPTTSDCVAWSEWAIRLEQALGIADEVPERLKNVTAEEIIASPIPPATPEPVNLLREALQGLIRGLMMDYPTIAIGMNDWPPIVEARRALASVPVKAEAGESPASCVVNFNDMPRCDTLTRAVDSLYKTQNALIASQQERERLREALEEIRSMSSIAGYDSGHSGIHALASKALAAGGGG